MSTPQDPPGQGRPAADTVPDGPRLNGHDEASAARAAVAEQDPVEKPVSRTPDTVEVADASAQTPSADAAPADSSAGGAGGKPPWQRVGASLPNTASPAPGVEPNNPAAEPTRPLVTGTKAPIAKSAGAPTAKAPIAKVDAEGRLGARPASAAAANGRNSLVGKVIDGPTRNIDRSDIPDDLPDLDAIHHPTAYAPPAPGPGPSGANPMAPEPTPQPGYAPPQPSASAPGPVRTVEAVSAGGARRPLRASVQLRRIDPWSTFKISAVLAIALFLIWMIATGVLYVVLDGMGVWDSVNSSFGTLTSSDSTTTSSFEVTAGGVFGISALIGAVYVIVFTALTTVGAFIYNMSADLVGGVEVTLADRD